MDEISDKSRSVTLVLSSLMGWFGVHRFYTGKIGTGILMALTGGGFGVWWLADTIIIAVGSFRDADGRRVWEWAEAQPAGLGPVRRPGGDEVYAELDALREEMVELAERLDFMERLVVAKDREALPPRI